MASLVTLVNPTFREMQRAGTNLAVCRGRMSDDRESVLRGQQMTCQHSLQEAYDSRTMFSNDGEKQINIEELIHGHGMEQIIMEEQISSEDTRFNEESNQNVATIDNSMIANNAETTYNNEATPENQTTDCNIFSNIETAFYYETANNNTETAYDSNELARTNETAHNNEALDTSGFHQPHLTTMKDWRDELYESVGGDCHEIYVDRCDEFAEKLLEIYLDPYLDLYKLPYVHFDGENGEDGGGLRKEYFWSGMTALRDGKLNRRLPFFEGENDFRLPTCDATILRRGYFKLIGKFMLHSAIHTGIGFVGLSKVVVQYIMLDKVDYETHIEINIRDLPDLELRLVVANLDDWVRTGEIPGSEDIERIQVAALDCGFYDLINLENISLLREHMLYFNVIEKRRSQLDCIRQAFQESKLMPFLRGRDYLYGEIFPRSSHFIFPASIVTDKIFPSVYGNDDDGMNEVLAGFVKEYVFEKLDGNEGVQNLVTAWTGWPTLGEEDGLEVQMTDYGEFMISTCSQLMIIPRDYTKEDVYRNLDMVLKFACYGFGSH